MTRTLGAAALAVTVAGLRSASEAATAPAHAGGLACKRQFTDDRSLGGSTTPTHAADALQTYAGVEVSAHLRFENGRTWEASQLGFLISTGRQTLDRKARP